MRVLNRQDWAGDFTMKRTRHTTEQIIRKLKTAEQLIAQGRTVVEVCRLIEVTPDVSPLAAAVRGDAGRGSHAPDATGEGKCPAQEVHVTSSIDRPWRAA